MATLNIDNFADELLTQIEQLAQQHHYSIYLSLSPLTRFQALSRSAMMIESGTI